MIGETLALVQRWLDRRYDRGVIAGHWRGQDRDILSDVLGRRVIQYGHAVTRDASRATLAELLTAMAGCELALAHAYNVGDIPPVLGRAEGFRLRGLLLLEIACCAGDPDQQVDGRTESGYRGPRAVEFQHGEIPAALMRLAFAYGSWTRNGTSEPAEPVTGIWERFSELITAVQGTYPDLALEELIELRSAHTGQAIPVRPA